MDKECKKHGLSKHTLRSDGRITCKVCNTEAVTKCRNSIKIKAIEYKGGCCEKCGYNKYIGALEFHHLDPSKKDFGVSDGNYRNWLTVKEEIDKCLLLCSNCHKETHAGVN